VVVAPFGNDAEGKSSSEDRTILWKVKLFPAIAAVSGVIIANDAYYAEGL